MIKLTIRHIPKEILLLILERLAIEDSSNLCQALKISEEMAFQYHNFTTGSMNYYLDKIYDYENWTEVKPNLAESLAKNTSFQSMDEADRKVWFAILTQDLELVNLFS
jgi:hypothetical protein